MNTFTVFFVSAQYKKEGKCRFKVSKPLPVTTGYYSLLFKKGTSYTKTISRGYEILYRTFLAQISNFYINTFTAFWIFMSFPFFVFG